LPARNRCTPESVAATPESLEPKGDCAPMSYEPVDPVETPVHGSPFAVIEPRAERDEEDWDDEDWDDDDDWEEDDDWDDDEWDDLEELDDDWEDEVEEVEPEEVEPEKEVEEEDY
jgi:hypothetical protein